MSRYQNRLKSLDRQLPQPPSYLDKLNEMQLKRICKFLEFASVNCADDNTSKAFEFLDNLPESEKNEIVEAGLNMGFFRRQPMSGLVIS